MKSTASGLRSPIFIHSLWRSSSTYFFHKFRSSEGYFAYQEPLHEVALTAVGNPAALNNLPAEAVRALRHPELSQGHFHELFLTHAAWKDHLHRDSIYGRYFDQRADCDLNAFLRSLIDIAPGRPVIQECRTSLRIKPIKESLGGFHIALVRNPWDQWWSFKATAYFEAVLQLLLQSEYLPRTLQWTRDLIGFREYRSASLNDEIAHFTHNPIDHRASYRIFFTLWCLAWLHARGNADLAIDVDALGVSSSYRHRIVDELVRVGIERIDFEDCKSFLAPSSGSSVFREIERSVLLQIRLDGVQVSDIAELEETLEQFTRVRAEHLREGGTTVALQALDRREETILLLQDSEHQLAAFYGGELERANAAAEGVRHELAAQQLAAVAREAQLSEERGTAFAQAEHLEAQLQQHSARVNELIEEQHKQAIERETLKIALTERSAASEARIGDLQEELGAARSALDKANESLAAQREQTAATIARLETTVGAYEARAEDYAAAQARVPELEAELAWRDAKLAEADQLIKQIRVMRETFVSRNLRRFARMFALPVNGTLDKALVGWQLAPAIVTQHLPTTRSDHHSMNRPNPYLRANSLEELCAFHDLDFVRCAYVTLLGRQPDPEGEAYYGKRLRSGTAKLKIVGDLRKSTEGRAHDPGIAGLDRAVKRHQLGRIPVLGCLLRIFSGDKLSGGPHAKLRIIMNNAVVQHQISLHIKGELEEVRKKLELISNKIDKIPINIQRRGDIIADEVLSEKEIKLNKVSSAFLDAPPLDADFTPCARDVFFNIASALRKES